MNSLDEPELMNHLRLGGSVVSTNEQSFLTCAVVRETPTLIKLSNATSLRLEVRNLRG